LATAAMILLLPAVWFAAWPLSCARRFCWPPDWPSKSWAISKPWLDRLARGAIAAGVVMLVQALALEVYASQTARSHELPWPLPDLLAGIAGLMGVDAAPMDRP